MRLFAITFFGTLILASLAHASPWRVAAHESVLAIDMDARTFPPASALERVVHCSLFQASSYERPDVLVHGIVTRSESDQAEKRIRVEWAPERRFSDGSPLRAEDVVYSFHLAEKRLSGPSLLGTLLSDAQKVSDTSVEFSLTEWNQKAFLALSFPIVKNETPDLWTAKIPTCGNFTVEELHWISPSKNKAPSRVEIRLGTGAVIGNPVYNEITLVAGLGDKDIVRALSDRKIDALVAGDASLETLRAARRSSAWVIHKLAEVGGTTYLASTEDPIFDRPEARLALSMLIDRDQTTRNLFEGLATPMTWLAGESPVASESGAPDLDQARELFARIGMALPGPGYPSSMPRWILDAEAESRDILAAKAVAANLNAVGLNMIVGVGRSPRAEDVPESRLRLVKAPARIPWNAPDWPVWCLFATDTRREDSCDERVSEALLRWSRSSIGIVDREGAWLALERVTRQRLPMIPLWRDDQLALTRTTRNLETGDRESPEDWLVRLALTKN
jgi:hypothetical protein